MSERSDLHVHAGRLGELPDCIEIRESVHRRMAPEGAYEAAAESGLVSEELESALCRRLFPSVLEEARFWCQAGKGRGIVLWTKNSMQYVPTARIEDMLHAAAPETLAAAAEEASGYDPLREAVVAMVLNEFERVVSLKLGETTFDSVRRLASCIEV